MKSNQTRKEVLETTEINRKIYKIKDKNRIKSKKVSIKQLKALLYSTALLLTFSTISMSAFAEEKIDTEVERCAALYFKETPEDKVLSEFGTIEEYEHLLKTYDMFDEMGDRIETYDLDFSNPKFSMNDKKYLVLNNNKKPKVKFSFNDEGYDFTIKFAQNNNPIFANKLSAHNFSYTYDLPEKFVKSDVYQQEEGVTNIRGYFQWKIRDCFDQQVNIMQYTLKNGKLEMVFQTIGTPDAPRLSIPNFGSKDGVNEKTVLSDDELEDVQHREAEAEMVEKQLKKEAKEKKKKAETEKRNNLIKNTILITASSTISATIVSIIKTKKLKSGEDDNENNSN